MTLLHCGNSRWIISKINRLNVLVYGFWCYWKHNILIQIGLAKSEDSLPNRHYQINNIEDWVR